MRPDFLRIEPLRLQIAALEEDPYTVQFIREHCNLRRTDTEINDELILTYMRAAIRWAEGEMHRTIFARAHQWVLRSFPWASDFQEIQLPRGKTQSIENITYSTNGQRLTLTGLNASPPGTDFQQDLRGDDGGVIMPPFNGSWRGTDLNVPDPVVINFTAGWSADQVPEDIEQALLFYVSDAYELRGTADVDKGSFYDIRVNKISGYMLHRLY